MNTCPHCGKPVKRNATFCTSCNKPLDSHAPHKHRSFVPYSCPHCGAPAELGQSYCSYCKKSLLNDTTHVAGTCALCGNPAPDGEAYCLDCRAALQSLDAEKPQEESGTHPCAGCGKPVWIGADYCSDCSKEMQKRSAEKHCPRCGCTIAENERYCAACRTPIRSLLSQTRDTLALRIKYWKLIGRRMLVVMLFFALISVCTHFVIYYASDSEAQRAEYQQMVLPAAGLTFSYPKKFNGSFAEQSPIADPAESSNLSYCFDAHFGKVMMTVTVSDVPDGTSSIQQLCETAKQNCGYTPHTCKTGTYWYEFYQRSPFNEFCAYEYGQLFEGRYYVLQFRFGSEHWSSYIAYWKHLKERFHPISTSRAQEIVSEPEYYPTFHSDHVRIYEDNTAPTKNSWDHYTDFDCDYPVYFYKLSSKQIAVPTPDNPYYYIALAGTADNRAQMRVKIRDKVFPDAQTALESAPHTAEFAGGNYTVTETSPPYTGLSYTKYSICCDSVEQDLSLYEEHIINETYEFILEFLYPTSEKKFISPISKNFV